MRVISIQQPWASLIVMGHKRIETRSWKSKYRGPLLIHASKGKVDIGKNEDLMGQLILIPGFMENYEELPYGKIVGMADVVGMVAVNDYKDINNLIEHVITKKITEDKKTLKMRHCIYTLDKKELAFGDYSENRHLWLLDKPVAFKHHYEVKGRLGLWRLDDPICLKCGCTEMDACVHPDFGNCWWETENLCSHCVFEVGEMVKVK